MIEPTRRWARQSSSSRGRPAEVGTLAVLYAAGALGCAIGAAFPMSDQAPLRLIWVVGAASAVVGGRPLAVRRLVHATRHARRRWLPRTVSKTLLIAFAATPQGEIVAAFGYLWIAVYVGPLLRPSRGLAARRR